ncbi:MAG: DUF4870 domain-containing protein [Cellvibrio sp.]
MDNSVVETPQSNEPSQDAKTLSLLVWLGTMFFGFLVSLIVFLIKKDDAYVLDQSREALNWSITAMLVSFVLIITVIGIAIVWLVPIINFIFCILGVIATSSGKPFRVPFALRLIK